MLKNAYFLAKIGADTTENEQHFAEILPIGRRVAAGAADRRGGARRAGDPRPARGASAPVPSSCGWRRRSTRATARRTRRVVASFWQNFGKMLLVFGCIGTDFCKKICVLQHFSKSTRLSSCNFWNLAKFCRFCNVERLQKKKRVFQHFSKSTRLSNWI